MVKINYLLVVWLILLLVGCGEKVPKSSLETKDKSNAENENNSMEQSKSVSFTLADFYSDNSELDKKVDEIFNSLGEEEKIAQMIVQAAGKYGKSELEIINLIKKKRKGGVLLLKGSKDEFTNYVKKFSSDSLKSNSLPLIFSADAEPSLINKKISGVKKFEPTNGIKNVEECKVVANDISDILKSIGINQNYAPVCDFPYNKEIIGDRSFGKDEVERIQLVTEFMKVTQNNNIIATAKHFPGHGNVKGDSHKEIVYIRGELKELNVFEEIINAGVISVMVGHIAIENNENYNTDGLPSTLSRKIVTDLLKNELGFKGLVVTDAMNMVAVSKFQTPSLKAIEAGCDMILMPSDEYKLILSVKEKMENDKEFREQVYESVRKVIRVKVCLVSKINYN